MKCLSVALLRMGIDAQIAGSVLWKDVPAICERLGLEWYVSGDEIDLDIGEPIIVVYPTRPRYCHAEFMLANEKLTGEALVGIITIRQVGKPTITK